MPEISPRPQALRSFTVRPNLPEALAPLHTLAMNLRWSWDEHTRDLFRWVGPDEWDASHHDPVRLLGLVSPARLDELAADPGFLRFLDEVHDELRGYLSRPGWFQAREADSPLRAIAYFSPEFGIAEALPQYSGGLGVLAGDHLKASSSLGLPLVGVGLFYRHGYFRQALSLDGWQQERYPDLDPYGMALTLEEGATITVELAGQPTHARIWRADVGRVPLYLLDTDVEDNPPELRGITDRLYGGDSDHRLRQEVLLGVGGVRALEALGIEAQVFHTNEGHAGFLGLERIRRLMTDQGLGFAEAVEAVRGGTVFTTHTPVPAGIDRFTREQMATFFGAWCAEVGVTLDELMAIGHRTGDLPEERFNMAVMGLRLASRSNAVAKLHGAVSREMFADLWPDVPVEEVPIGAITNGVHAATWVAAGDRRRPLPPRAARVARGRARAVGPHPRRPRRRPLAGQGHRPGAHGRVRPPAAAGVVPPARLQPVGPGVVRRRARPQRPHHRLRPPLRHLQARHPAAAAARAAPGAARQLPTGPCSSSSPASPTPPTTRASP